MTGEQPTNLSVHRCRFIDYTPSPITALAFSPLPLPPSKGKRSSALRNALDYGTLAVGRANGNIELCRWTGARPQNPAPQAWAVIKTLPGPIPSKVDSLAFAIRHPEKFGLDDVPKLSDLRLFSSGGGPELLEWDMERTCVRRTISSQGGSIWSIAVNPSSSTIALGCEDGSVRLLSLVHDTLIHQRHFDRVKCRLLSIAWGPPVPPSLSSGKGSKLRDENSSSEDDSEHEDDWSDSWLITGCSDSALRKWDIGTGRVVERMSTEKIRGERTLVWAVGILWDGTIVSGDSMGIVKFWDSRTCTQLQSFQGHSADVLCLTIGSEGTTVYTSGVDQKISQFSFIKSSEPSASTKGTILRPSSRWVHSCSRRLHSHDVRALASWPPHTALPASHRRHFAADIAPIIASGGLDISVVLTPAALPAHTVVSKVMNPLATSVEATFSESYQRKLGWAGGPNGTGVLKVAKKARLVVCMEDTGVGVWRIKERLMQDAEDGSLEGESDVGGWDKVLEMELNVQTNLIACAISDNGRWLAVSDLYETRLFVLEIEQQAMDLKPKRIRDFASIVQAELPDRASGTGASAFAFTPDGTKLIMTTCLTSYLLIIDLANEKPRILRRFEHHRSRNTLGQRTVKGLKLNGVVESVMDDGDDTENSDVDVLATGSVASIVRIAVSIDGQWLATSDDLCQTHVFNLDSVQHCCILPSSPQPAHALAFDPTRSNVLILGFADNSLLAYDVERRSFPDWSQVLCKSLPKRFTSVHDPILGVTFDPKMASAGNSGSRPWALFWGATWMCKVPLDGSGTPGRMMNGRKRKMPLQDGRASVVEVSTEAPSHDGFKMITQYRPLLGVDFLSEEELVVVERPLVDVLAKLPPAFFKPKYGVT